MADDIVKAIQNSRTTFSNSSSDELTLEKAREDYRRKVEQDRNKRAEDNIKHEAKLRADLEAKGIKENSKAYLEAMRRNQETLLKYQELDDIKRLEEYYSYAEELEKDLAEHKKKLNEEILKSSEATTAEKTAAFTSLMTDNLKEGANRAANRAIDTLTSGLNGMMEAYAQNQAKINARVQGAGKNYLTMEKMMSTAVGIQPYIKNQALYENLAALVDSGIAYNVELRSFIQTMKENIATTFDATNGTLLRLIRLQQSDSTAARLGLEASLTRFFNGMYQNTEYLTNSFDTVANALIEASSTMGNDRSIQFEYQVQKWLGSLYGVGMSDATVSGLAQALGYLGSGNVSALAGSQYQNLLVMAASRAGLGYGDLLIGGLDSNSTNALLRSMVEYLQEIAAGTNQVVKSELGRVFGVSMSDLTAALNLNTSTLNTVSSKSMNYASSIAELMLQMQMLPTRMSIGTMMDNVWNNLQWGLASNIASNPALYAIWKVTSLIQDYTGGINVPAVFAMGSGFNLNTTVENLVKLGVVGVSSLGMIGDLISGLSSTAAPASMLLKMGLGQGISNMVSAGGRGLSVATSGLTTSSSVIAGNSSGEDIYTSAKEGAKDGAQEEADAAEPTKMEEWTEMIQNDVSKIYDLLASVIDIDGTIRIRGVY